VIVSVSGPAGAEPEPESGDRQRRRHAGSCRCKGRCKCGSGLQPRRRDAEEAGRSEAGRRRRSSNLPEGPERLESTGGCVHLNAHTDALPVCPCRCRCRCRYRCQRRCRGEGDADADAMPVSESPPSIPVHLCSCTGDKLRYVMRRSRA
jgi:hypothetical protein